MTNVNTILPRGPGHCDDDAAWAEFVRQYDGQPRTLPELTDFALANAVFMADRNDLNLIHYQTAAKERIRWLSIELAKARAALAPALPVETARLEARATALAEETRTTAWATIRTSIFAHLIGVMPRATYDHLEKAADEAVEALKNPTISWVFEALAEPCEAGEAQEWRSPAASDVLTERRRQTEVEGWTPEHDDEHSDRSMALAAACYAMFASLSDRQRAATDMPASLTVAGKTIPGWAAWLGIWPWARSWWKPKDRRRDLVRAGALILAEIERLDRAQQGGA